MNIMVASFLLGLVLCPQAQKDSRVELELIAPVEQCHTVDLIPLCVRLVNKSAETINLPMPLALESGLKVYFKTSTDAEFVKATFLRAENNCAGVVLERGKKLEVTVFLSVGLSCHDGFKLPKAGGVLVRAFYPLSPTPLASNTLSLTLKPSDGLPEPGKSFFGSEAFHRFVLQGGRVSRAEDLKPFVERLGTGTDLQNQLLSLCVGQAYQAGFEVTGVGDSRDRATGQVTGQGLFTTRVPDHGSAIKILTAVSPAPLRALRERALVGISTSYLGLKQVGSALKALEHVDLGSCDTQTQEAYQHVHETIAQLAVDQEFRDSEK